MHKNTRHRNREFISSFTRLSEFNSLVHFGGQLHIGLKQEVALAIFILLFFTGLWEVLDILMVWYWFN